MLFQNIFRPKLYHFEYDHMEIGTMLAVLDNNNNTNREHMKTVSRTKRGIKVKSHYRIAYRKSSKKFIARKFYEKKKYEYLKEMMFEISERALAGNKCIDSTKRKRMAPTDRNRRELIEKSLKYSRFK